MSEQFLNQKQIYRLLKVLSDQEHYDVISWIWMGNDNFRFLVNCNDQFYWGCGDAETVSSDEDIDLLLKSSEDAWEDAALLYCARKRGMRPQGAAYSFIQKENWHLFDACGPEREVGFGNPFKPGQYDPSRNLKVVK